MKTNIQTDDDLEIVHVDSLDEFLKQVRDTGVLLVNTANDEEAPFNIYAEIDGETIQYFIDGDEATEEEVVERCNPYDTSILGIPE